MDYLHRLGKICESAEQRSEDDEMEGNLPFQWTLDLDWIRQNRRENREAFMERSKIEQKTITSLDQLGFAVKLSPSSSNITPNINLITLFLILRTIPRKKALGFARRVFPIHACHHKEGAAFGGKDIFNQVRKIFAPTQQQLQPRSKALFREGAERLLIFGLGRLEEAIADLKD